MMDFSDYQEHPDGMSRPKESTIPELGSVVDALPGLVWTTLPDGQVDFVNQQWRETGTSNARSTRGRRNKKHSTAFGPALSTALMRAGGSWSIPKIGPAS
jgi:hypothetical protein